MRTDAGCNLASDHAACHLNLFFPRSSITTVWYVEIQNNYEHLEESAGRSHSSEQLSHDTNVTVSLQPEADANLSASLKTPTRSHSSAELRREGRTVFRADDAFGGLLW